MKIYKTQKEVEKDIKDNILNCKGEDVKFECDISIEASIINAWNINAWNINARNINARNIDAGNINAWNINAWNINARNINARNIDAGNIDAWDINAWNIDAWNINARNINARNIDAGNIDAWDINARNIDAEDIKYYAFCISYNNIKCKSWESKRDNAKDPICLDGELIIKEKEEKEITLSNGAKVSENTIREALKYVAEHKD